MNKKIESLGNTALSLLSNTIIVVPYLLYIQLSDGHNLLTILPFVLFYTLRMTGIFLVRGINLSLTSLGLLKISLLLGLAGSLIGIAAGAERPLKKESDYEQAVGKYIHISLYQAVDGEKQIEGTLVHLDSEQLTLSVKIKTRVKEMTFERKNIAKARLAIQF